MHGVSDIDVQTRSRHSHVRMGRGQGLSQMRWWPRSTQSGRTQLPESKQGPVSPMVWLCSCKHPTQVTYFRVSCDSFVAGIRFAESTDPHCSRQAYIIERLCLAPVHAPGFREVADWYRAVSRAWQRVIARCLALDDDVKLRGNLQRFDVLCQQACEAESYAHITTPRNHACFCGRLLFKHSALKTIALHLRATHHHMC